jgi:hypothetical protein
MPSPGLSFPTFPSVPTMAQESQDFVEGLLTEARAQAVAAVADARTQIGLLSHVVPPGMNLPAPPKPPVLTSDFSGALGSAYAAPVDVGTIDSTIPSMITLDAITIPDIISNIPDYVPIITGYILPEPPIAASVTFPDAPTVETDFTLPDAPTPAYGDIPTLTAINIPTYSALTLEPFGGTTPTFGVATPSPVVAWTEPAYQAWIADSLKVALASILATGEIIPSEVERAIWERDRNRLDIIAAKSIAEATDEYAAKGFSLPPGMLLARISEVRRDNDGKVSQLSRDQAIDQAKRAQDNVQFAIKTGAELEATFVQIFLQNTQHNFDIAKYAVEARIQIFNTEVERFNVEEKIFAAEISKYEVGLKFALAQLDQFKALLEAEKLKSEVNRDLIEAYKAKIQAFTAQVEAYKSLVDAAGKRADLQKNKVEIYKTEIDAVGSVLAAKKNEFDAYVARVQGESSKAQLEEANAKAYAARIGGITAVADIQIKEASLQFEGSRLKVDVFKADLDRLGQLTAQQLALVQAKAAAYETSTRREIAQFEATKGTAELNLQTQVEASKVQIAYYQAALETWKTQVTEIIEFYRINADSIKAAGQIAATLAAGSMAGTSVSAAFNGSVSRGETTSQGETYSESKTETSGGHYDTNVNYNHNIAE